MNESLNPLLQFDEGSVVSDRYHLAMDTRADRVLLVDVGPGIWKQLLQAETDTLPIPIDIQHFNVDVGTDRHHLGRVAYATPRHVGDVKQPI